MISEPTNAHKCMKVCYTHRVPTTCVPLTWPSTGRWISKNILQRNITDVFEQIHRYKIINFKIICDLKYVFKITVQIKIFVIDAVG